MSRVISGFYLRAYSKICGFTLVELVAALAVVGVLAVTVTPTYHSSVARGRRAEAKVNLQEIASLQGIYVMENDVYATLPPRGHIGGGAYECDDALGEDNALGFRPEDCRFMRYGYKSDGGGTGFCALAKAKPPMQTYPGCTSGDGLELTHNTEIGVCMDAVKNCPGDGTDDSCGCGDFGCNPPCTASTPITYSNWGLCVPSQSPANVCTTDMVPGTRERTKTTPYSSTDLSCTCGDVVTTESEACSIPGTKNCPPSCSITECCSVLGAVITRGDGSNCDDINYKIEEDSDGICSCSPTGRDLSCMESQCCSSTATLVDKNADDSNCDFSKPIRDNGDGTCSCSSCTTPCDDGCTDWGAGNTDTGNLLTDVWNQIRAVFSDSVETHWTVTWSGGDPTESGIVDAECKSARDSGQTDPIDIMFYGTAQRTRQCPDPNLDLTACPLAPDCNTQEEHSVWTDEDCDPTCDETKECCDGVTPRDEPDELTCPGGWYGKWDGDDINKGCCRCGEDQTFGEDKGRGNCCPNSKPSFTFHEDTGEGFCCPNGYKYSYDDSGHKRGACCPTATSYSYDPGNPNDPNDDSGGCCTERQVWKEGVCAEGCGATLCCKNGLVMSDSYCREIKGDGWHLQLPNSDPDKPLSDCKCVECRLEDACKKNIHTKWDSVAKECNHTDEDYPGNPKYIQHPDNACLLKQVMRCADGQCCEADGVTLKEPCLPGWKFKDPAAYHSTDPLRHDSQGCDCIKCNTDPMACRGFTDNFGGEVVRGVWRNNSCTHPSFPASDFTFTRHSTYSCSGYFKKKCDSDFQCCDEDDDMRVLSYRDCDLWKEKWHGKPTCECKPCEQPEICKKYGGEWKGGICEKEGYSWVWKRSSPCSGHFVRLSPSRSCDSETQCCRDDSTIKTTNDCQRGYKLEYGARPPNCDCVECELEDACGRAKGTWNDGLGTCTKSGHKFIWNAQNKCDGRFIEGCPATAKCCNSADSEGFRTIMRDDCGLGNQLSLIDPENPGNQECICQPCRLEQACENNSVGRWKEHEGEYKCRHQYHPDRYTFIQSAKNSCTGDFHERCNADTQCCNDAFTVKTNDHCEPGKRLKNPPEHCDCVECGPAEACRNSGYTWKNGRCTRSGDEENEYVFIQYPHDRCRGFWQEKCEEPCDSNTQCCVNADFEVTSASEAGLACDSWYGDWNSGVSDKGCCRCEDGKTFSYDHNNNIGGCCPVGQSYRGNDGCVSL